jgi:glutaredoxin 3
MATVLLYTTQQCPFCTGAKALLQRKGVPYQEIDVGADTTQREKMIEESGRRTVPQVFINGVPIGGFEELRALDTDGGLDRLLAG